MICKRWTADEKAKLLELARAGRSLDQMASTLGRTRASVDAMLTDVAQGEPDYMEIRAKVRGEYKRAFSKKWTPAEIEIMVANAWAPVETLVALLPGRQYGGIRDKLYLLANAGLIDRERGGEDFLQPHAYGDAFFTSSGQPAIRLAHGVVPYVKWLYGDRFPPPAPSP
jgi:hypothetical protein